MMGARPRTLPEPDPRPVPRHAWSRPLPALRAGRGLHLPAQGRRPAALARRPRHRVRGVGRGLDGRSARRWAAIWVPARVRAVVSISGPPYASIASDRRWWAAHRHLVEAGRFEEYFDANVHLRMGEEALRRLKARPERYAEATQRLRRHSVASFLALLDETYSRPEWVADCARIRCPVLVVWFWDHFPTVAQSRRVADTIPGARLHVVQGRTALPQPDPPSRGAGRDRLLPEGRGRPRGPGPLGRQPPGPDRDLRHAPRFAPDPLG